jgi:hypothetical protein
MRDFLVHCCHMTKDLVQFQAWLSYRMEGSGATVLLIQASS